MRSMAQIKFSPSGASATMKYPEDVADRYCMLLCPVRALEVVLVRRNATLGLVSQS